MLSSYLNAALLPLSPVETPPTVRLLLPPRMPHHDGLRLWRVTGAGAVEVEVEVAQSQMVGAS